MLTSKYTDAQQDNELYRRTKAFALRVIRIAESLPSTPAGRHVARQFLRCGTSVGANYRSARRSRTPADFLSRMGIVEEEADECLFWMELIVEACMLPEKSLKVSYREADEILAMVVASIKTAKAKRHA